MNPLACLGKQFSSVQEHLSIAFISEVFDEIEPGEKQQYSVISRDGTWEFSLNSMNRIETIFLFLDKGYGSFESISSNMSKADIISLFGVPYESGEPNNHPILGSFGAWEKYERKDHFMHIEHMDQFSGVKTVTLMVLDPSE